jgi:hypothetical protein
MEKFTPEKLLKKQMSRREFLQFAGGSALILFGLGNVLQLLGHVRKTADTPRVAQVSEKNGFGSRKFGA